jgi:hypothetical protein
MLRARLCRLELARWRAWWLVDEKERREGMGRGARIWSRISVGRLRR